MAELRTGLLAGLPAGLPTGLPQLCVLLPVLLHHLALLPKGPSALSAIETKPFF
jgi:hypothetical protein